MKCTYVAGLIYELKNAAKRWQSDSCEKHPVDGMCEPDARLGERLDTVNPLDNRSTD